MISKNIINCLLSRKWVFYNIISDPGPEKNYQTMEIEAKLEEQSPSHFSITLSCLFVEKQITNFLYLPSLLVSNKPV